MKKPKEKTMLIHKSIPRSGIKQMYCMDVVKENLHADVKHT